MAGARGGGPHAKRWPATLFVLLVVTAATTGACSSSGGGDEVPLFLFAGQSNMAGAGVAGELPVALARPRSDTRMWDVASRRWVAAGPQQGVFGPELSALARLADGLDTTVLGVKVAVGDSSLFRDWDPERGDGLYDQLRTAASDAVLSEAPGGGRAEVVGFFWMQGEADARDAAAGAAYRDGLTTLVRRVRADFGAAGLPCVFGRIRIEQPAFKVGGEAVRRAYADVAQDVGDASVVDTDDLALRSDQIHFDSQATVTLGRRFADAWLELR